MFKWIIITMLVTVWLMTSYWMVKSFPKRPERDWSDWIVMTTMWAIFTFFSLGPAVTMFFMP